MLLVALYASAAPGRVAVVGKTAVDFGEYPAGESRDAVFRIRNIGKGPLTIVRVRKGCGCATVQFGKPVLAPGEETDIHIRVLPYSIFGPYSKTAYVDTSDPLAPHTRLKYGGNAKPLIAVTPRQFDYVGRIPLHQRVTRTFTLTPARDGVVFGEPDVRASLPVRSSLKPVRNGPDTPFALSLSFTATNNGPLQVAIDLPVTNPTNHPPIKLGLAGSLGCELVAVPARLRLPAGSAPQQRRVRLRLIGPIPQELDGSRLHVPSVEGMTHDLAATPTANTVELTLTFAPAFIRALDTEEGRELVVELPGAAPARIRCLGQK